MILAAHRPASSSNTCSDCHTPSLPWRRAVWNDEEVPMAERGWRITDELRSWQEDAIGHWKRAERCGVIEAATGTGKTMVALAAMDLLAAESGDRARVAVVVSSIEMAAQWRANLIDRLGVSADEIAEWHTAAPRRAPAPGKVVIAVINSARTRLPPLIRTWRNTGCTTLLVVDECHHAASPENRKIFEAPAHQRIGLSATKIARRGSSMTGSVRCATATG